MATTVTHHCDRCGAPSTTGLPVYSLRFSEKTSGNRDVYCGRGAELCPACSEALRKVVHEFHDRLAYIRKKSGQASGFGLKDLHPAGE